MKLACARRRVSCIASVLRDTDRSHAILPVPHTLQRFHLIHAILALSLNLRFSKLKETHQSKSVVLEVLVQLLDGPVGALVDRLDLTITSEVDMLDSADLWSCESLGLSLDVAGRGTDSACKYGQRSSSCGGKLLSRRCCTRPSSSGASEVAGCWSDHDACRWCGR